MPEAVDGVITRRAHPERDSRPHFLPFSPAPLKRGIYGTFHHLSKKHLPRYVDEFVFRYNARKMDDGARTALAIRGAQGKRLMYREPV